MNIKCKFIHNLNLFILFIFKILIAYSQECVQLSIFKTLYINNHFSCY
jgi:hypothetical protein